MELYQAERGSGKTKQCIEKAAEESAYIVCRSHQHAFYITKMADSLGLDIPFPITFDEFLSGRFAPRGIKRFIIDDLDEMIYQLARSVPVSFVTWTQE